MGKGSKTRPTNLKKFYKNFDSINWGLPITITNKPTAKKKKKTSKPLAD